MRAHGVLRTALFPLPLPPSLSPTHHNTHHNNKKGPLTHRTHRTHAPQISNSKKTSLFALIQPAVTSGGRRAILTDFAFAAAAAAAAAEFTASFDSVDPATGTTTTRPPLVLR
ncbi:hypothetical protein BJV74DRAFT_815729 [Russula compacta]|nr:hypothetical protein BJV74DRAFT_815729 [Russula compacta]